MPHLENVCPHLIAALMLAVARAGRYLVASYSFSISHFTPVTLCTS